ncbi:hypothetical protein GCM10028813_40060 [Ramlibacter alkalitolerans]
MPEDKAQENLTDPDSRIMKRAGGGFDASYNAQTAVDGRPTTAERPHPNPPPEGEGVSNRSAAQAPG